MDKFLRVISGLGEDAIVQTQWYSYNVFVRGLHNIFRYDNQDEDYLRSGHQDEHHKHIFDWRQGYELLGSPIWVGVGGWLTLGDVLQEAENWYWEHKNELPEPDIYPDLNLR